MNWLVIPIEDLKQFDENWETRRKNVAGTEAIVHEEIFNRLIPPIMTLGLDGEAVEPSYPFPLVGDGDINDMLNTEEWSNEEESV